MAAQASATQALPTMRMTELDVSAAHGDPDLFGQAQEGTCWTQYTQQAAPEQVDCAQPHRYEILKVETIEASGQWDENALDKKTQDMCVIAQGAYSPMNYERNGVGMILSYPSNNVWSKGGQVPLLCGWDLGKDETGTFKETHRK